MKYTIITQKDNKVRLTLMEEGKFLERIQRDARRGLVERFRHEVQWKNSPKDCFHYEQIPRVCPTSVLRVQENGALAMVGCNGLVLLDVKMVVGSEYLEEVKNRAMTLPTTLAAFVGCSGQSVKVLVRVARPDGSLPQEESAVEAFYQRAYATVAPLYRTLLRPYAIPNYADGPKHSFLMPFDPHPRVNPSAQPIVIDETCLLTPVPEVAETDASQGLRFTKESDYEAFDVYERTYARAAKEAVGQLGPSALEWDSPQRLQRIAELMRDMGTPQEETFTHIWRHLRFHVDSSRAGQENLHRIVDSVFEGATSAEDAQEQPGDKANKRHKLLMGKVIEILEQRYVFRYNVIMGYTEYRRNTSEYSPWRPVTERVMNDLIMELQMAGVATWGYEVRRYVESNLSHDYNVVDEYLMKVQGRWDGQDHIRRLARTVPTQTPEWPNWFHRFFLGMVAQWQHGNPRFGNAIVPLLISRQGYHKSDFCRQLLPPELRSWGYTANLTLSEERTTLLTMTQMLLICLDEFNQISPKMQEGFLKNIITMPTVKVKRPYARHVEDIPRLASFIATTNQTDTLADPSGSRRFIGILIDGDIDTRQTPNYEQLFAQAVYELEHGEQYWFDAAETNAILRHNRRFQLQSEAMTLFFEYFDVVEHEDEGEWLSSPAILADIRQRGRGLLKTLSINKFARELRALPGIRIKQTRSSDVYLVRRRT